MKADFENSGEVSSTARCPSLQRHSSPYPKHSVSLHAGRGFSMRIKHTIPSALLPQRPVRVLVVGAGGTGSSILMGLPYLDQAMRAWGHPYGIEVAMMDADRVTETNCVRQPFSVSDVGQNKAIVLINRINLFWGTEWSAIPAYFHEHSMQRSQDPPTDILIGCVDTRAARKVIEAVLTSRSNRTYYWLDLGNNSSSGQYV